MMTTITRWVLAHKRIVATFWILVTVVGFATVSQATKAFSNEFSVPGREGFQTNRLIQHLYHQGGDKAPIVPVVTLSAQTSVNAPAVRAGLNRAAARLQAALPGARIASYASTGSRAFVSKDGHTTFMLAYPLPDNEAFGNNTKAAKAATAALAGMTVAGAPIRVRRRR
jgi:putative drug exporter of the RND superfamily